MKYISTRGDAPALSFEEVVLTGLASDGGLYVPASLPVFTQEQMSSWVGLPYTDLVFEVVHPFVGDDISHTDLRAIIERAYHSFRHPAIAPLVQTGQSEWVLELFHGPTLAFKDFALQFLGHLVDFLLERKNQRAVVLGATSGDTGSAAIEGCKRCKNLDIFILHPHGRVSEVQRRQMTTVDSANVHNIAVKGNFDDCQNIVKASFRDQSFLPSGMPLMAVNSINWARIMAQIVYYFYASFALGGPQRSVSFSVPTGNFGDIYAGYLAAKMGLPIEQLIIATNANDILHRCISANDHTKRELHHSLSPSMDIMVSSNFERLLFDLYDADGKQIKRLMDDFEEGSMVLSEAALTRARTLFSSFRQADTPMLATIRSVYEQSGYLLDPHTAIGVAGGRAERQNLSTPMVNLATAHPAKFPEAIARSLPDVTPPLPTHMANLFDLPERYTTVENELAAIHAVMNGQLS